MNTATHRIAPHPATDHRTPPPPPGASDLADLQRLSMREVRAIVGLSESRIRELIAAGRFPEPDYRDGPRCTRWSAGRVRQWLVNTTAAGA